MYNESKVLKYNASGDLLIKKAVKLLEEANYIDALPYLRRAVEQEPGNMDYTLALAEVYTDMNRFEDSNATLILAIRNAREVPAECYFGMGCNFMGLNDLERATQNFERYLDLEPEGEFAPDAQDLLELMELADGDFGFIMDAGFKDAEERAREGKELLDEGRSKEAISKLSEAIELDCSMMYAKNNLALACYCAHDLDRAIEITREILVGEPNNIHANCNMAIFMREKGDMELAREFIRRADGTANDESADDIQKVAFTLCELGMHEEAAAKLKKLIILEPFDVKALFCMGIACANTGRLSEASRYLGDIIKLAPDDGVAPYYKNLVERGDAGELSYVYQVPFEEIRRRIELLNNSLSLKKDELLELWHADERFASVLKWGLNLNDVYVKQVVLDMIASFGDKKSIEVLSRFILKRDESDELKNYIFLLLKHMGVKEPYTAYLDNNMVEVKVGIVSEGRKLPDSYQRVTNLIVDEMTGCYAPEVVEAALDVWRRYLAVLKGALKRINSVELWAAALEYIAVTKANAKPRDIAAAYGVNERGLKRKAREILGVVGRET